MKDFLFFLPFGIVGAIIGLSMPPLACRAYQYPPPAPVVVVVYVYTNPPPVVQPLQ